MEKQAKPRVQILKLLPNPANFYQNLPFSPSRDHKRFDHAHKHKAFAAGRGFSGPIHVSMIPDKARRRYKNIYGGGFETQDDEPTSPKVSCIGQIKHKKKIMKIKKCNRVPKESKPVISSSSTTTPKEIKKHSYSTIRRLFSSTGATKPRRKSDASSYDQDQDHGRDHQPSNDVARAPALGQMKRFASDRGTLANFDWTAQVAPVESDIDHQYHLRDYYSDEERVGESFSDDEEEEEDHDEVIIPFSAPIVVDGGCHGGCGGGLTLQPKKEINLWKRRTMNPPRPLQLNYRSK